jgi:t-SNARE complex subunit (syntaxin)
MAQTNPRWLIEKAPADIKGQVRIAVQYGYQVVSQTHSTAQLMRKKRFSCLIATVLFLCFALPFFIYLFYYLAKKDDLIYLDLDTQPSKAELEKQIASGITSSAERNKKILYGILIFFGVMMVIGIIGNALDGSKTSNSSTGSVTSSTTAK